MTDNRHPSADTPTAEPVDERLPYTPPQVILYSRKNCCSGWGRSGVLDRVQPTRWTRMFWRC